MKIVWADDAHRFLDPRLILVTDARGVVTTSQSRAPRSAPPACHRAGSLSDGAACSTGGYLRDGRPTNRAMTDLAALRVTVQVVPEAASHPLQPVKEEPLAGVAVSVTVVPLG